VLYPSGRFLLEVESIPRALVYLEGLDKLKKSRAYVRIKVKLSP
jgi:hypothetical protein